MYRFPSNCGTYGVPAFVLSSSPLNGINFKLVIVSGPHFLLAVQIMRKHISQTYEHVLADRTRIKTMFLSNLCEIGL